jgi:hypothetical protein
MAQVTVDGHSGGGTMLSFTVRVPNEQAAAVDRQGSAGRGVKGVLDPLGGLARPP